MEKFSAEKYFHIGAGLGLLLQAIESGRDYTGLSGNYVFNNLSAVEKECLAISLVFSASSAKRIGEELKNPGMPWGELKVKLDELRSLIGDEMKAVLFLHVRGDLAGYFKKPYGFDDDKSKPSDAFPSITVDVESAGNCLTVEMGTACVFHLMRIMEAGLKALAIPLGIPYAPSWESYLNQIAAEVAKDWKNKDEKWKKEEVFFKEGAAHLSAVKVAWRNPTMHIVRHYDVSEAREIFSSARTFMRHLATKLKE